MRGDRDAGADHRLLAAYVRALWGRALTIGELPAGVARAALAPGTLMLPSFEGTGREVLEARLAAAAHAGAHLAFGGEPFECGTLKPVQQAIAGVLEDARVEWWACRRFPGLRERWIPHHVARDGTDVASLLARLARVLADSALDDPHPWVRKGRALFFAGTGGGQAPLADPQALRVAASVLGHDLGQMRARFDARHHRVEPAYRDDNAHLWRDGAADGEDADPVAVPAAAAPASSTTGEAPDTTSPDARHPEWDRLIGRLRRDWVSVFERPVPGGASARTGASAGAAAGARSAIDARLLRSLVRAIEARSWTPPPFAAGRTADGERFDPVALVEARIDQRMRVAPDPRVFVATRRARIPMAVVLLVDASASTAQPCADAPGETVLERTVRAALLAAGALETTGHACELQAFRSFGRHAVEVHPVKRFEIAAGAPEVADAAARLAPGGSTRIGAAVRHAVRALARRPEARRLVVLLTDGEPHDVDVHDPRYLVDDLRAAVEAARARGVGVVCLDFSPEGEAARAVRLHASFRRGDSAIVRAMASLPRQIGALLRVGVG